jgi:hypothetical protein
MPFATASPGLDDTGRNPIQQNLARDDVIHAADGARKFCSTGSNQSGQPDDFAFVHRQTYVFCPVCGDDVSKFQNRLSNFAVSFGNKPTSRPTISRMMLSSLASDFR